METSRQTLEDMAKITSGAGASSEDEVDVIPGASKVGREEAVNKEGICFVDNNTDVLLDSGVLLPRHKRVTSGYNSDEMVTNLSADDIGAEIRRVEDESAKIKRHLAILSHNRDRSSRESGASVDNTEAQRQLFRYVTTRGVHRGRERQQLSVSSPTTSQVRLHTTESAPATSSVRQLSERQPTVRQLNVCSPTTSSVRQHREHQPTSGRQPSLRTPAHSPVRQHTYTVSLRQQPSPDTLRRQFIRHHLFHEAAECEPDSGVNSVGYKSEYPLPRYVSDRKYSSVAEGSKVSSCLSSKPKSAKATGSDREVNARLSLKKSAVHDNNLEDDVSVSVKPSSKSVARSRNKVVTYDRSTESEGDTVDKHALSVCADVARKSAKFKSKSGHRRVVAVSSDEFSDDNFDNVERKKCVVQSEVKNERPKQSKQFLRSDLDDTVARPSKKQCVSSSHAVSDESCSDKPKSCVKKLSYARSHRRLSPVRFESESESDNDSKSCVSNKRRAYIKPDKFDGVTPTFATFRAHFENAARFNKWDNDEQLAFLKSSLTGTAAQCLWDQSAESTDTLEKLWKLLSDRFAGQNLTEKYRTELRNRRRKPGESLDALCQDIRRLLILGYPGPTSSAHDAIAKDSFIDALSSELSLKVRERDPSSLDSALHTALRLEAIHQSAAVQEVNDDNVRVKGRVRGITADSNQSPNDEVLAKLKEMQSQFSSDMKAFGDRLNNVESATRSYQQSNVQQSSTAGGRQFVPKTWHTNVQQQHQPVDVSNGLNRTPTSSSSSQFTQQRACYVCGDPTHLKRQCPNVRNGGRAGQQWQSTRNNDSTSSGRDFNQGGAPSAAATRGLQGQLDNGHVYLVVYVDGRKHLALLDSGCELSLAPSNMVDQRQLRPSQQRVFAANGSSIQILGETDIEFDIGGCMSFATVLVTPDVSELMLGITWLTEKQGVWDFSNRSLHIHGMSLPLHSKKSAGMCRRVYVQEDIVVEPRQQVAVPARSTVSNLSMSESNNWLMETKQLRPGVLVARTLLPDRHRDIAVRVVNTTSEPQKLPRDTYLGNLQAVEVCDQPEVCDSSTPQDNPTLEEVDSVSEMMQSLPDELSEEQRETVSALLHEYEDVFSKGEFDVGCTRLIEHHIETGQHRPVRQALRRHPVAYLDAIDEHVDQLRQRDMVEPSGGPWCSNIVVVRRKDGRLRLCVDYRCLNARTYYDSYPLPNIEATLDALGGSSWFCTLDLRSGYHNVVIAEEDRDKTQFITRRGTFRWKRMPFGLSTAPGTFQRLMDLVMCGLSYESVLVYLDDLIIMASSFEQLVERFAVVLDRLRAANLKLNCRKCNLFQRKVSFLGHVVSESGIEVQPEKTEVVRNWPVPKSLTELRSFLGLASYYRRFLEGFSIIAAPLYSLMRKGQHFRWGEDQQQAFDELKKRLTTAPVLASPRSSGTYYLDTDASEFGLGIVLSQEQEGLERVLAYASRSLNPAERNYSITRKELLAVIFGLKRFRQYLIGREFVIRTDHSALQWLRRTPEPIAQAGRWLAIMEEFNFVVQHRAGSKHQNADALSRYPVHSTEVETTTVGVVDDAATRAVRRGADNDPDFRAGSKCPTRFPMTVSESEGKKIWNVHTPAELAEMQRNDPDIGPIVRLRLEYDEQPSFDLVRDQSTNTKIYWSQWPRLSVREGVVYRVAFDRRGRPDGLQLLVPVQLRSEFIECVHSGLTGSHVGLAKTMFQLVRRAWWRGWRADVRRQLKRCSRCSRYHRGALPRQGSLQPTRVGAVFERLSIDLTGPHPRSRRGYVYILTVVCPFSKFCECLPLRNKEAVNVARALVEEVFCRYGTPLALLSDRGGEVDGQIMKEVCRLLQIDKLRTSAYHPACNAACERMHRTLNSLLGKVVSDRQTDWDEHLPYVSAALRASRSESTGYSPNFIMFGREVNTPADIVYGLVEPEPEPQYDEFVETVRDRMVAAYDVVRENLGIAAERNKRYYNMKGRLRSFQEGDLVYYFNPRKYSGRSEKWARKYTGPYRVDKVLSPVTVLLRTLDRRRVFVSHIDKLKPSFEQDEIRTSNVDNGELATSGVQEPAYTEEEPRSRRRVQPPCRLITEC